MEDRIARLEAHVAAIQERNHRVEAEKAWETSWFRVVSVATLIFCIATLVLYFIGMSNIFLSALIPTAGYVLSNQSLPMVKKWWMRSRNHQHL